MKKLFLASVASLTLEKLTEHLTDVGKMTVAFIPTAADPYKKRSFVEDDRKKLIESGFNVIDIDLKGKTGDILFNEMKEADIIFVAGGNTFYLLEKVNKSGFDKVVKKLVKNGTIYIGSSAGAIITCPTIEHVKTLDDPMKAPELGSFRGLCLVDFLIFPHFDDEKHKEKYDKVMDEYGEKFNIVTLTDVQAIMVTDDEFHIVEAEKQN